MNSINKFPLETIYFVFQSADSTISEPIESLLDLAIPESFVLLYFPHDPKAPHAHALQILADHKTEFPNEKEQRFHIIDTKTFWQNLGTFPEFIYYLPPSSRFLVLLPPDSARLAQVMVTIPILQGSGRHLEFYGQHQSSSIMKCIPDIHLHSISNISLNHQGLFIETLAKILKILMKLGIDNVFCAGSFGTSFGLSYLPFSPLLIFNCLVREGVLKRATSDQMKRVKSKKKHVVHLLDADRCKILFQDVCDGKVSIHTLIKPLIYLQALPHTNYREEQKRKEFEEKLKKFEIEILQHNGILKSSIVSSPFKQSSSINLVIYEVSDMFDDGYQCSLTVDNLEFISSVYQTEKEAKDEVENISSSFFRQCWKLSKEDTSAVNPSSSHHQDTNPTSILNEYCHRCSIQLPQITFDESEEGKSFIAKCTFAGSEWASEQYHEKKHDAKLDLSFLLVRLLSQTLKTHKKLLFDPPYDLLP